MPFIHFAETSEIVEVKQSTIPGAGQGLFAKKAIKNDDFICWYSGVLIDNQLINNGYYYSKYIYQHPRSKFAIDAEDPLSCFGRYINDSLSLRKTNCEFHKYADTESAHLVALRNIKKGEEIFVQYGKEYWKDYTDLPQADLDYIKYDLGDTDDEEDDDEPPIKKKTKTKTKTTKTKTKTKSSSSSSSSAVIDLTDEPPSPPRTLQTIPMRPGLIRKPKT